MAQPEEQMNLSDQKRDVFDEEKEKCLAEYEETMRIIKEATGVSDIDEVILKFKSQNETNKHLLLLQKQNEESFEVFKKNNVELASRLEDVIQETESKNAHVKRMQAEFLSHLEELNVKFLVAKSRYERTGKIMANAKTGIQHLGDKLEGIQLVRALNNLF